MVEKCKRIFIENKVVLFVNFAVLCFLCGGILKKYQGVDMGIWGYILSILTNHYYILYCVFPILLIIIARYIKNVNDIEMIRYSNAFQQIKIFTKTFIQWLLVYMVLHLFIIFIIGIRTFDFSIYSQNISIIGHDELVEILNMYIKYFDNTIFAVVSNVGYFLFGFSVLITLLLYINYRYKYKSVILVSVLVYIFTFIGFKTELKSIIPIVCFDNFILLHHGLFINGGLKFLLIILFGVFIIQFCFGKTFKINYYGFNDFIISKKEKFISFIIVLILFLLEIFRTLGDVDFNFRNVIVSTFFGINKNYISFILWMRLTILYLVPLFFIGIAESRIKKYEKAPILIRSKSKLDFECKLIKVYVNYICLYAIYIFFLSSILYFVGGFGNHGKEYLVDGFTYSILSMYFIIFFINLIFDFIVFKVLCKFANEIVSFLLILFFKFIFFMVPAINLLGLNFGISNLFEGLNNNYELVIKVTIIFFLSIIYFVVINRRRIKYGNHQN